MKKQKSIILGLLFLLCYSCNTSTSSNEYDTDISTSTAGQNKSNAEVVLTPAQKELLELNGSLLITSIELIDDQNRRYIGQYDKETEKVHIMMVEGQMSVAKYESEINDPERTEKLTNAGIEIVTLNDIDIEGMVTISNNFKDSVIEYYGQTGNESNPGKSLVLNYQNYVSKEYYTWNASTKKLDGPFSVKPSNIDVYLSNAEDSLHTHGNGYSASKMKTSYTDIKNAGGKTFTCQFTFFKAGAKVKNLMEVKDAQNNLVEIKGKPGYFNFGNRFP